MSLTLAQIDWLNQNVPGIRTIYGNRSWQIVADHFNKKYDTNFTKRKLCNWYYNSQSNNKPIDEDWVMSSRGFKRLAKPLVEGEEEFPSTKRKNNKPYSDIGEK